MQRPILDRELIQDIAIELGISPAFIEKDFYACKILDELSGFDYENARLIFTGGTCLSKGYGLIKRFSEDIDFRVLTLISFSRTDRKRFREAIISRLKQIEYIEVLEDTLLKWNVNKFFSFYIKYPKMFEQETSLRSNLKLEFTFEEVSLPVKKCPIQSITESYTNGSCKIEFDCISPIEVAANKFSALIWRIDIRSKGQESAERDGTLMRHLHDLAALEKDIKNNDFIKCLKLSFEQDKGRGGSNKDLSLIEFSEVTLNRLKSDKIYSKEYKEFVDALSYAKESETIDFEGAVASFDRIINFIRNN